MKNRIREIREAKGLTQDTLASLAHITRVATLSDLENGKTNPRLSTLEAIAGALKVRVVDLFDDDGGDPSARDLVIRILALSDEQREAFLKVLPLPQPRAK